MVSKIFNFFSKNAITSKTIKGSNKRLYYEKAQHLKFLFQNQIKYEKNIQNEIKKYLKQGDLVFDIGANIGQYALPLSEIVGKSGKVYAFEPDHKSFSFLKFNSSINKCSNIACYNYGVGKSDSEQEFFRDTKTGGRKGSFIKEFVGENFKGAKEKSLLKSFDTIISLFGTPNFVKIDVEGFEEEIIDGLTYQLAQCVFLIEVRETTKLKIFNYFYNKGYTCKCVDKGGQQIEKAEEIAGFANLIFEKANR